MDANQPEAVNSLHRWKWQVRSDITLSPDQWKRRAQGMTYEDYAKKVRGRADLFCGFGGRSAAIEVKNDGLAFAFENLEPEKRVWAETWCRSVNIEYWIWLRLGVDQPHLSPDRWQPMRTWLVPYPHWLLVESRLQPHQKSIPYLAGRNHRIEVREQKLDAIHQFAEFELVWTNAKTKWGIRESHPFFQMYMKPDPLPLYESSETAHYVQTGSAISLDPIPRGALRKARPRETFQTLAEG